MCHDLFFRIVNAFDEIVSWLKRYFQPNAINQETLAMDFIGDLNSGKNPLASQHTFKHVRFGWQPNLFDRSNYDRWYKNGSLSFEQQAREKANHLIEAHSGAPLSDAIKKSILSIRDRFAQMP